jgi:ribosome-binding ATPase YchF (GTP1/OBG family)
VRDVPVPPGAADAPRRLHALTSKPVLYVVNVDEGTGEVPDAVATHAQAARASAVAISARIEAELSELGDPDAEAQMRAELGIGESGLEQVIHAAWDLLGLISFFTGDTGKETMARALPRGATVYDAAGRVHTDIQRGFVRAEVIGWRELVDAGGYVGARDRGLLRVEGRDYVVQDGDVITIKH